MSRRATVLVVVAGIAALMAATTVALLVRMRSDGEESATFLREVQARAMLTAGLQYVCEAARLGWDDPETPEHEEAFGWLDVRDGTVGPKDRLGRRLGGTGPGFPAIGGVARCPMPVLRRPPYAIAPIAAANPIGEDPTKPWSALVGYPNPDPVPTASTWADFVAGDRRPVPGSEGRAWFRVRRETPTVFVITCGAGATLGYADWPDVVAHGAQPSFVDQAGFESLRVDEVVLRFRCEWCAAVGGNSCMHYLDHEYQLNRMSSPAYDDTGIRTRQSVGTILWIQRLLEEPAAW